MGFFTRLALGYVITDEILNPREPEKTWKVMRRRKGTNYSCIHRVYLCTETEIKQKVSAAEKEKPEYDFWYEEDI